MTKVIVGGGSSVSLRGTIKPSMVYPGAGIALSTGSAWGTSITDNSSNWNTAYGWGDHASAGYLTSLTDGNGTTVNGADGVDWGGTLTTDVFIDGNYGFNLGNTTPLVSTSISVDNRIEFNVNNANGSGYLGFIAGSPGDAGFHMEIGDSDYQHIFDVSNTGALLEQIDQISADVSTLYLHNTYSLLSFNSKRLKFETSGTTLDLGSDATGDTYYRNSSGYFTRLAAGTNGDVLTLASGIPSWAAPSGGGGAWSLASGGTLTGANTITGTTTNILKANFDDITTSQVNGAGLWLANNTAASAGAQRLSPSLVLEGQGWKTTATAASQSVRWAINALPIQGISAPTTNLQFSSSINGGAYGVAMTLSEGGNLITSSMRASAVYGAFVSNLILQAGASDKSISAQVFNPNGVGGFIVGGGFDQTRTSGDQGTLSITQNFVPTSGTATYYGVTVQNTINQTGGANGQVTLFNNRPTLTSAVNVTGFDYNPTVTSVSGTHLAYRSTSGNWAMQGSGTTFTLGGGATASQLRFLEPSGSGTNYSSFKAVAQSADIDYSLPPTVGAAGTVLTDVAGNGVLTWAAPSGGSGITRSINSVSGTTSAGAAASTDYVYNCTSTFTLTLPTAVGNTNRYTIKNSGTGTITVNTTSSQTIDGSLTAVMSTQYSSIDVISNGTNWLLI